MTKKTLVEFFDTSNSMHPNMYPVPAKKMIPDWYKSLQNYAEDFTSETYIPGVNPSTVKRCIPVFDAMTAGYIITTPQDIAVENQNPVRGSRAEVHRYYKWPNDKFPINFHAYQQAEGHPYRTETGKEDNPKFTHPWGIRTPKGYSCLFIPPVHRESPFRIMEGVVDTDSYHDPVHFPFYFVNPKFTGLIPAGTPLAQVIPFKRESYEHSVVAVSSMKENIPGQSLSLLKSKFLNGYRKFFWEKKDYS